MAESIALLYEIQFNSHLFTNGLNLSSIQCAEAKYTIFLKQLFLIWLVQLLGKKNDKSKFSCLDLLFKHLKKIKLQPKMNEQEKKRQRIYDLLNAETKLKSLCLQ